MKISPTIKNPCPADWDKMKIGVNSRFCGSCEKHVVDFTKKSREEILEYLILNYGQKTCGHFYRHQLDYADTDFVVTVQELSAKQKDPRMGMAILVFGSMLMAGCNGPTSAPSDTKTLLQKDSIELVSRAEIEDSINSHKQDSTAQQDSILAAAKKAKEDSLKKAKVEEIQIDMIEGLVTMGDIEMVPIEDSTRSEKTDPINYVVAEMKPEFPGGMEGLNQYIYRNIHYPAKAKAAKEQGQVYITFIINKKGKVKNPEVVRSASLSLDSAALHTISNLPDWKPGEHNGQKVEVEFTVPVNFRL